MILLSAAQLYGRGHVIVQRLRDNRDRIAEAMLDGAIRRHELTVGNEVLALAFVDRFIDALASSDWPAFFGWIDRICEKHAGTASTARLLTGGAAALGAYVEDDALDAATVRAEFAVVGDDIRRIVERPRASREHPAARRLDEVDATLDRLISRLSLFDAATAEHSRAVAMWCARIGKKLSLSAAETTLVTRAGLIHDIGKVTTPLHILNAPHRLSEPDMVIMRLHAEAGATIVQGVPQLEHLVPAVRAHHERIDGRGYPDGRSGSEIPLLARIVSVADSFNAMIGNRPYRPPMAPTIALEQLREHSGTQFDHNVVSAMIEVMHPRR